MNGLETASLASDVLVGALTWTLLEYVLHRFAFHGPGARKARWGMRREHTLHHARSDYFATAIKKGCTAAPTLGIVAWLVNLPFAVGLGAAWIGYEVVHRRLHTHPPVGSYGRWARRHHFHHHFTNPSKNHGVTSPFWDMVFRTRATQGTPIRIPLTQATRLPWLLDSTASPEPKVQAPWSRDYEVVVPSQTTRPETRV